MAPDAEPVALPAESRAGVPTKHSNLVIRILSAAVLAPLAIAAAYFDGWLFVLFWAAAAVAIVWEWFVLVGARAYPAAWVVAGALVLIGLSLGDYGRWEIGFGIVLLGALAAAMLGPQHRRGWLASGTVYAAAALFPPVLLRRDAELGLAAILFVFAVVWGTDIFAYFVGRAVGGPKLAPSISPNKTWSGAIGGTLAALMVGAASGMLMQPSGAVWLAMIAFSLSVIAQVGDLFESRIKRRFGVKNSSELIPGHGGLMDRLDGFVAAALAAAVIGVARGGVDAPARGLMLW